MVILINCNLCISIDIALRLALICLVIHNGNGDNNASPVNMFCYSYCEEANDSSLVNVHFFRSWCEVSDDPSSVNEAPTPCEIGVVIHPQLIYYFIHHDLT